MNRILTLLCTLVAALGLSACATRNPHKVMDQKGQHAPIPVRAAVVDFQDNRQTSQYFNQTWTMIPIVGLWGGYYVDKHDAVNSSATEPFPRLMAKELTNRLKEASVFEQVDYVSAEPEPGTYDVVISGRINQMRAEGAITRYGLSLFGDLLWEIGLPYLSRRWNVDMEYTMADAYTGQTLLKQPERAKFTTTRTIFTKYYTRGKVVDLKRKLVPAQDQFIASVWKNQPTAKDTFWADLRSNGQRVLASRKAEADLQKKGSPPVFTFTSPTDGSSVREGAAVVRWSVTAPGGVKTIGLTVNGQPVALSLTGDFSSEASAPKSIPAQELRAGLSLGTNRLEATVSDHRGNTTTSKLTVNRLPAALNPDKRYALLIGAGSPAAQESVSAIQGVLANPAIGQFEAGAITAMTPANLTRDAVTSTLGEFGRRPIAGELVFVYLAVDGDWASLKIGDGSMTLDEFVKELKASVSTENVVLLADVNWTGTSEAALNSRLTGLPRSWAVLTPNAQGGPSPKNGSALAFAAAVVRVLRGENSTDRLTLERFVDRVVAALETKADAKPEAYGRYTPSLTLAERE